MDELSPIPTPPIAQPISQPFTSSDNSVSKRILYPAILSLCLLIIIILSVYSFYYLPKKQINQNVPAASYGSIAMPFDYRNPAVQNYALVYKFEVNVKDFTQTPQGVVINTVETGLPPIVITKTTQIFKLDKAVTPTYAKLEDITNGSQLSLNNVYNPEKNEWITSQVYIYQTPLNK